MKKFKAYLLEYLTDKQRSRFSHVKMTPDARNHTDQFFGPNNDIVHGELGTNMTDKSEIHKKVENHLGTEISHDDYRSGLTKDRYGRPSKIGRQIKDSKLRDEYATDPVREGSRSRQSQYSTSTVRGVEVAGQTNPVPNAEHPGGHSWKDLSCKNIETGINRTYLDNEIRHGTVVHRVHDHNGQEIYRAALQPHFDHNHETIYTVSGGEYGIKHPEFRKDAHRVAIALSSPYKGDHRYEIHPDVYHDAGPMAFHPAMPHENIMKHLKSPSYLYKEDLLGHPGITSEHLDVAQNLGTRSMRASVAQHPNATPQHLDVALRDPDEEVRGNAARHPNATSEQIHKALDDRESWVREAAATNPSATREHIDKALSDDDSSVRGFAAGNRHASAEQIHRALTDQSSHVRGNAAGNPSATPQHLDVAQRDRDHHVRLSVIYNRAATKSHIENGLKDNNEWVRQSAETAMKTRFRTQ